jgi:hypothetical protein
MARGWESKSVEDQIDSAKAEREARAKPYMSPEQRAKNERKASLLLSRAQILRRLETATNSRYRAQLENALAHLDAQLEVHE